MIKFFIGATKEKNYIPLESLNQEQDITKTKIKHRLLKILNYERLTVLLLSIYCNEYICLQ